MQRRFESNRGDGSRDVVLADLGIALHSSCWHVSEDLRSGRHVVVMPDDPIAATAIRAVTPQRRMMPPRVSDLVDFLTAAVADPPWGRRHCRPLAK